MVYPFKAYKTETEYEFDRKNNHPCTDYAESSNCCLFAAANVTGNTETATKAKKRNFKIIDEALLQPEEAELVLAKRAYNRECANRARKRKKELVEELQKKIDDLQTDKDQLRRTLKDMEIQLQSMQMKNEQLKASVQLCSSSSTNNTINRRGSGLGRNATLTEFINQYTKNCSMHPYDRQQPFTYAIDEYDNILKRSKVEYR